MNGSLLVTESLTWSAQLAKTFQLRGNSCFQKMTVTNIPHISSKRSSDAALLFSEGHLKTAFLRKRRPECHTGLPQSTDEAVQSSVPLVLALNLLPALSATGVAGRHPYVWELRKAGSTVCF